MTDPVTEDEDLEFDEDIGDEETSTEADVEAPGTETASDGASPIDFDPDVDVAAERGSTHRRSTEVVALQEQFESLNDRHLRLAAEFNNFRRRSEQERLAAWSRAQADLLDKFLDILDDLQRVAGLDLTNATVEAIMEGIDLVERKFVRVIGDSGAEVIDPTGQPFDPESMEAMMRVPTDDAEQADTVAQVFQKGYSLKGVLIRPARVSVFTQG